MTNDILTVQYDMCGDGSMWEGFAYIVQELPIDGDDMIHSAKFAGYAPNGCPILEVKFGNIDVAKSFTAVYFGLPDADDADVLEYLGVAA
jgi:hypothetical protein